MKSIVLLMVMILGSAAWAEETPAPAGGEKPSAVGQIKETVRDGTRAIGHFFRDATRAIGHGTRDAAKTVGTGAKEAAEKTGEAATDAWKSVTGEK